MFKLARIFALGLLFCGGLFLSLLSVERGDLGAQQCNFMKLAAITQVPSSSETAFFYCLREAESGNSDAQFTVASMYFNGKGVAQDRSLAEKWYRKDAEQGRGGAQFNIDILSRRGKSGAQDKGGSEVAENTDTSVGVSR